MKRSTIVLLLLVGALSSASAQEAAPAPRRVLYAAAWDSAVAAISRTWVDTAFISARWVPAARAARDSAIAAPNDREFRALMRGLIARIPASHFYLLPAPDPALESETSSDASPGTAGLTLRLTDVSGKPQVVVSHVQTKGAAARAGIRPGDIVRRIDGREMSRGLRALPARDEPGGTVARARLVAAANALVAGAAGDVRTFQLVRGGRAAAPVTRRVTLDTETRPLRRFGNLPPMAVDVSSRAEPLGQGAAAVVRFDAFLPALMPAIDDALFAARSCSALILDLRGNPGGLVGMIGGIAGHLLPSPDTLAVMTMRESALRLVANPRTVHRDGTPTPVFDGPVLILMDEASASASEILAGALQALGRARLVGTRSAGMSLPAHMRRLPTGDVLVHATADITGPHGGRAEGEGLTPDLPAPLDPRRLATGEDPALAVALAALRATPTLRPAGPACRS
jgi:carboxyl-terminal processing protease